jgi:hypothetical protein
MKSGPPLLNDHSEVPPKIRVYLNLWNLAGLPAHSIWPGLDGLECLKRLEADGFEGVQLTTDTPMVAGSTLPYCGVDKIDRPADADRIVKKHADRGDLCLTVHAGTGIEDDDEAYRIIDAILAAAEKHSIPTFVETHRATITQDLWRTVNLTKRFPEILFNGDFSHYYCGQEMPYGDWNSKIEFMQPIFDRVAFMHGRISSSGCMQVPIDADIRARPKQAHGKANYLEHFRELWIRAMLGFLRRAQPGDFLIFAPEILSGVVYYARMFPDAFGQLIEESDRYQQALLYKDLALDCFEEAKKLVSISTPQ